YFKGMEEVRVTHSSWYHSFIIELPNRTHDMYSGHRTELMVDKSPARTQRVNWIENCILFYDIQVNGRYVGQREQDQISTMSLCVKNQALIKRLVHMVKVNNDELDEITGAI